MRYLLDYIKIDTPQKCCIGVTKYKRLTKRVKEKCLTRTNDFGGFYQHFTRHLKILDLT